MKAISVICFMGLAFAAQSQGSYTFDSKNAVTLLYENENTGHGSFKFAYLQSDGTEHEQQGELVGEGQGNARLVVRGKYTFNAPDGFAYVVRYVADENGYRPEIEKSEQKQLGVGILNVAPDSNYQLLIASMVG